MPNQTTILSPNHHEFLAEANAAFAKHFGVEFPVLFDRVFEEGVLYKTPDFFAMALPIGDTWHIVWARSLVFDKGRDLLRRLLPTLPYTLPYVEWGRGFRDPKSLTRYETLRLFRHAGVQPPKRHYETAPSFAPQPFFDRDVLPQSEGTGGSGTPAASGPSGPESGVRGGEDLG